MSEPVCKIGRPFSKRTGSSIGEKRKRGGGGARVLEGECVYKG